MLFVKLRRHQQSNGSQSEASICAFVSSGSRIRLTSWNARALMCAKPEQRRRTTNAIKKLIKHCDLLLIQEAHGFQEWADVELSSIRDQYVRIHSGSSVGSGGIMFAVRASFLDVCPHEVHAVIDCRAAYLSIVMENGTGSEFPIHFVNVHN